MTFQEYLNQFIVPINSFLSWFSSVANSLITNYIFLTFIGLTLFVSLVYFLINCIIDFFDNKHFDIEKKVDYYSDKTFSHWHDKISGVPLSKAEENELNDILDNF